MRIRELDGLRAIAILLVIGCHYAIFARQLRGLPQYGWMGVDIFFVLSGFLITSVLLELRSSPHPFKTFYFRRSLRILPPYFLAVTALTLTALAAGERTMLERGVILKNVLFLQAFTGFGELLQRFRHSWEFGLPSLFHYTMPLNLPGLAVPISSARGILWSLSVEEYFYLLWAPAVLWLKRSHLIALAVAICIFEMLVRWAGFTGRNDCLSIYYRFDALIFGALVALLPPLRKRVALSVMAVAAAGLAMILFALAPFVGYDVRESVLFMVFGLPCICICAAGGISLLVNTSGAKTPIHLLLRSRLMVAIGTISYMLYLVHGFVYLALAWWLGGDLVPGFAAVPISIALAALSWKYVEKPVLGYRNRVTTDEPKRATATA